MQRTKVVSMHAGTHTHAYVMCLYMLLAHMQTSIYTCRQAYTHACTHHMHAHITSMHACTYSSPMPKVQELSQQDKEAVEMQKQQTKMQLLDNYLCLLQPH